MAGIHARQTIVVIGSATQNDAETGMVRETGTGVIRRRAPVSPRSVLVTAKAGSTGYVAALALAASCRDP